MSNMNVWIVKLYGHNYTKAVWEVVPDVRATEISRNLYAKNIMLTSGRSRMQNMFEEQIRKDDITFW